jgi:hypothetical protein
VVASAHAQAPAVITSQSTHAAAPLCRKLDATGVGSQQLRQGAKAGRLWRCMGECSLSARSAVFECVLLTSAA